MDPRIVRPDSASESPTEERCFVVIPAGVPQRITNNRDEDVVFYCICTPRFRPDGYEALP